MSDLVGNPKLSHVAAQMLIDDELHCIWEMCFYNLNYGINHFSQADPDAFIV